MAFGELHVDIAISDSTATVTGIITHVFPRTVFNIFRYTGVAKPMDSGSRKLVSFLGKTFLAHGGLSGIKTGLHDTPDLTCTSGCHPFTPCLVD